MISRTAFNSQYEGDTMPDSYEGIPAALTLDFVRDWVRQRLSQKRFRHVSGVADLARRLAMKCSCDPYLAELAGWLHDACKQLKDQELVSMAAQQGLTLAPIEKRHGHLLHGPVASGVVRSELAVTNEEVLQAISEHTLGAAPMSTLSKVLFLADCLEENRPREYTAPIWAALDLDGSFNIDKAIVVACDLNLQYLLKDGKPVHPRTIEVRNYYLERVHRQK